MQRLAGTDMWHVTVRMPHRSRVEYQIEVDYRRGDYLCSAFGRGGNGTGVNVWGTTYQPFAWLLDVNDGRRLQELRFAAAPVWEAQLVHPFVRGIGDGSLDPSVFERWVRQDYLYLIEFARVFAWAVTKSDRLESMSWHAAALHLTLNTEMALHREYAGRFGITPAELEAETLQRRRHAGRRLLADAPAG